MVCDKRSLSQNDMVCINAYFAFCLSRSVDRPEGRRFKSFMMIAGTLAFMIFNGGYAFASGLDAVSKKGD